MPIFSSNFYCTSDTAYKTELLTQRVSLAAQDVYLYSYCYLNSWNYDETQCKKISSTFSDKLMMWLIG